MGLCNLRPFKRFLLFVLMALIDMSYHTKLFAYSLTAANRSNCATVAGQACAGFSTGVYLSLIGMFKLTILSDNVDLYRLYHSASAGVSGYRSICICFTKTELEKLQSCDRNYGSCGTGATGMRMHVLRSGRNSTGHQHISCGVYMSGCTCNSGYYAIMNGCLPCPKGYYCPKKTPIQSTYAAGGSTQCPTPGVTSGAGANSISRCYIPTGYVGKSNGHTYKYIANCFYGS